MYDVQMHFFMKLDVNAINIKKAIKYWKHSQKSYACIIKFIKHDLTLKKTQKEKFDELSKKKTVVVDLL